ncbi:hypothetical protein [Jonesia quinghaiensis]|uniref:hypothetical protein n=1 Tax=Jonesia quinghaiensis TaxID=262806 RepID=UPI0004234236|nr:hypothetical protein [Jonesia quinghaiensis]
MPPAIILLGGFAVAGWLGGARYLWGLNGDYATTYLWALSGPILALHLLIALYQRRARRVGFSVRKASTVTLCGAWLCLILVGLFIPDRVNGHLTTILTGSQEPGRGLVIGFANPLGIIGVALLVATLIMSIFDARGPRISEDDLLDRRT